MNVTNLLKTNDELFKLSFEYLILRLCQEYCKENSIEGLDGATQIDRFNRINNITLIKVLVYPFFISFSNGHLHSLFELFGSFHYSKDFGYISKRAITKDVDDENFSNYFSIDYDNIKIKSTHSTIESQIQEIKSSSINIQSTIISFDGLYVDNEKGEESIIFKAIDSGINAMMKATFGQFVNLSEFRLRVSCEKYSRKMEVRSISEISQDIDRKRKEYFYTYA